MIDLAQLKHQVRKDLRRTYGMLAAFGFVALASILLSAKFYALPPTPCLNGCTGSPTSMLEFGIGACLTLLLAITSVTLVQDDAPIDANAFWVSQPLRVRCLLLSKVLLTLVYFLVITTLVQMATIKVNGLSVRGSFGIVATSVYWYASLILVSMLIASITRGIQSAILVGVALLIMRVLVAGGVFGLSPRLAQWLAEVGGVRGDVWIVLALGVFAWTYAAKSVRSRSKIVVTGAAIVALTTVWKPGVKAPSDYLDQSPQSANTSLPAPSMTAEFRKGPRTPDDQLVLTLVTKAPRPGYRFRLARYAVTIQRVGTSAPPDTISDVAVASVFVNKNVKGDSISGTLENRVSANIYIRLHDRIPGVKAIRDGTARLTVSGFLVEEMQIGFANTPVRAGQSTLHDASRFTIRSVSADSMAPQIAFDETSGGAAAQYAHPFVDGRVFVTSADEMSDATPETWVRFHGGQDSLRLVNINAMQCYAIVVIPSSGIRRTCGSMRALRDSIKGVRGNPDWLRDGELYMTQWRYTSYAPIRLVLPLRAKN